MRAYSFHVKTHKVFCGFLWLVDSWLTEEDVEVTRHTFGWPRLYASRCSYVVPQTSYVFRGYNFYLFQLSKWSFAFPWFTTD